MPGMAGLPDVRVITIPVDTAELAAQHAASPLTPSLHSPGKLADKPAFTPVLQQLLDESVGGFLFFETPLERSFASASPSPLTQSRSSSQSPDDYMTPRSPGVPGASQEGPARGLMARLAARLEDAPGSGDGTNPGSSSPLRGSVDSDK